MGACKTKIFTPKRPLAETGKALTEIGCGVFTDTLFLGNIANSALISISWDWQNALLGGPRFTIHRPDLRVCAKPRACPDKFLGSQLHCRDRAER